MKKNKWIYLLSLLLVMMSCKDKPVYVQLETTLGTIIVKLYDETPLHKENFIKLVEDGYYDGVLFHRVIDGFMVQTGDPDSKHAEPGQRLGSGGLDYTIPAEFNDSLFHKKGALAAARDNNPEKASSGSQFYIVDGETVTDEELDNIEARNSITFTQQQREYYKTIGGSPFLDQRYTVFGEVVRGIKVVDSIANVKVDHFDRPKQDIRIIHAKTIRYREN